MSILVKSDKKTFKNVFPFSYKKQRKRKET